MTFRQVTKEEKGPNIAVRSPIAEKRRRESEEKEKVKVGPPVVAGTNDSKLKLSASGMSDAKNLKAGWGSSYSSKPCGWCAVSSPCGKFEHTLPTPLREDFGPNAKARDAIQVDFCEAFPLPEGIGNPPPPPARLRPQPSYVEVKREPRVGLIVDAPETSVAPVSSLEPSAPLKGLCHHIPERLGKDTLLYGP
ncbi:hypothetical protein GEV33_001518 [Tenebrio molitor]|uniref:Uncharacterized protein n=1 Tax=Tenebrio molitor TaxID=7067 RepID=A0A8J6LJH0_TENMO|nr:hypothetical protein GEV33_001518 [Tenebrio molitor]